MRIHPSLALILLALATLLTGCAEKYGAVLRCSLDSTPQGAKAYLIPTLQWDQNGGLEMANTPALLEKYYVGTTPVPNYRGADLQRYVYLVQLGDRIAYQPVYPQLRSENRFTLVLP